MSDLRCVAWASLVAVHGLSSCGAQASLVVVRGLLFLAYRNAADVLYINFVS